ncbi:hypothetical protein [Streptomyces sp. NBC_01431]|uniref:hypothetical protein n=1 Tax=Streptomyces sp. NBC_01431 TaxID=2903863 RepID=UPI002E30E3FC|nr:hypothetical protein [Streptomyces sp. NBC_01431]
MAVQQHFIITLASAQGPQTFEGLITPAPHHTRQQVFQTVRDSVTRTQDGADGAVVFFDLAPNTLGTGAA